MADDGRQLLIRVEDEAQRESLLRFLGEHGCEHAAAAEPNVVADDLDRSGPGLATLVALVEEWRSAAHVAEAVLELGDRRTILRTEV